MDAAGECSVTNGAPSAALIEVLMTKKWLL